MRRSIVFVRALLVVLGISEACAAQQSDATMLFEQANQLYEQGNFQDALRRYAMIKQPPACVLYNMGNCAYRTKQYGLALALWRGAQRNAGWWAWKDLHDNIVLVRARAKEQAAASDQFLVAIPWWWQVIQAVAMPLRSVPTSILQFLCVVLCMLLAIAYWLMTMRACWSTALLLAFMAGLLSVKHTVDGRRMAVVVSKQAALYSGPGQSFCVRAVLPEATEVYVTGIRDSFCKVHVQGIAGWVSSQQVHEV